MTIKLDIGCGDTCESGWTPIDIKAGTHAYPLDAADGSVDEIRASHILEHFPHGQVAAVLADWVRALAPGGLLRVAVPDFEAIARTYLAGHQIPVQGYVMGGQVDSYDYHQSIFDAEALTEILRTAGLIGISRWTSDQSDCAALPISLNLQGIKPPTEWPKTHAVMSVPRLGWNDMWGCAFNAFGPLGIRVTKHTGAFWEQCLTRALHEALATGAEYILTVDYDSVFSAEDVRNLLLAAMRNPQADAIAALQVHRTNPTPLLTLRGADGKNATTVPADTFDGELTACRTAHFGLTLLRADALKALPRPWFLGEPDSAGEWGDARTDADISFWRRWEAAGFTLHSANRVPIGHLEVMVRWPNEQLSATWQHPSEYHAAGKPADIWR